MTAVAGGRIALASVSVSLTELVHEAVAIERWKVLRAVSEAVGSVPATSRNNQLYRDEDRPGRHVKADILAAIAAVEREVG